MGRPGLEPGTNALKGQCFTSQVVVPLLLFHCYFFSRPCTSVCLKAFERVYFLEAKIYSVRVHRSKPGKRHRPRKLRSRPVSASADRVTAAPE